ncbi:MAG TPA: TolC family protein [Saprospiraceae bacterium]|nr:TolC family protein [Saprospiraceae bacterium]
MKNIKYLFSIVFLLPSLFQYGQHLTLEQAVATGLKNSEAIRLEKEKNLLNDFDESALKATMKPKVSLNADLRGNIRLQESVLPFSFGPDGIEEGETVVPFGRRFNHFFSVEAQQKILDFSTKHDKELINIKRSSAIILEKEKADELKDKIKASYYNLIYRNERFYAESAIRAINKEVVDLLTEKEKTGTIIQNQYLKAKLDLMESDRILKQETAYRNKAKDHLYFLIGQETLVSDSISINGLIHPELPMLLASKGIESLKEENYIAELEARIKREGALKRPTINAYGNFTTFQQSNTFNPFENNTWFQYSFLGVRLNWTIFDGKSNQIKQDKYQLEKTLTQKKIQIIQNERNQEVKEIYAELLKDKENLSQIDQSIQIAAIILDTDIKNYNLGITPYSDVLDSKKRLANLKLSRLEYVINYLNNHFKWQNLVE